MAQGLIPPAMGIDPTMGGTTTPTATPTPMEEEIPTPSPSIDVGQLYLEWASLNPNAGLEAAFSAGMDAALAGSSPVGMGMVDEFADMPYDPSMQPDVLSGVDTFGEISPTPELQGEFGQAAPGSWRDTVIDVSDVQPGGPQG